MLIKKGLDIPIAGKPSDVIDESLAIKECAVLGADFVGLKPKLVVQEGDKVLLGAPLFYNKDNPAVQMTAPCSGEVVKVNRGYRRALQSVVIADDGKNQALDLPQFPSIDDASNITAIKKILSDCGQWVAFRTRPFSVVPDLHSTPNSIFVTAIDTNPLALNPQQIIDLHGDEFSHGLKVLSVLAPKVHVCTDEQIKMSDVADNVEQHYFSGVHPAGLAGTHIHYIDPIANADKTVWTINYQEVIAIGYLALHNKLWTDRYIALCGPRINNPRIVKIKLGSNINELAESELLNSQDEAEKNPVRLISGSVLHGHQVEEGVEYLGRYDLQVSAIDEGLERPLLHYVQAGKNRFSKLPIYISRFMAKKQWNFTSTTNGSSRAMVPIGIYEEIMPLDILPTQLLRALIVGDIAVAQQLGCLELDEEDLALCTYVCPGKYEYGPILRDNLQRIQKEG